MLRLEIEYGELSIDVNKDNVDKLIFDLVTNKNCVEVGMKTEHGYMTIVYTEEQVQKLIDHLMELKKKFEDEKAEKMPKLTDDKRQQIKAMYESGAKVKDILSETGIAKATFYSLKKGWVENDQAIPVEQPVEEVQPVERSVTFSMDPIEAGLDKLNPDEFPADEIDPLPDYQPEPTYQGETRKHDHEDTRRKRET